MHIVMDDVIRSGWWTEENFATSPQPQASAKFCDRRRSADAKRPDFRLDYGY